MKLVDFDLLDVADFVKRVSVEDTSELVTEFEPRYFMPMSAQLAAMSESRKSLKHLSQQSSLLSALDERNLLRSNLCYIELGAGKAGLSEKIAEHVKDASFVIVDRATVRQKKEKEPVANVYNWFQFQTQKCPKNYLFK